MKIKEFLSNPDYKIIFRYLKEKDIESYFNAYSKINKRKHVLSTKIFLERKCRWFTISFLTNSYKKKYIGIYATKVVGIKIMTPQFLLWLNKNRFDTSKGMNTLIDKRIKHRKKHPLNENKKVITNEQTFPETPYLDFDFEI